MYMQNSEKGGSDFFGYPVFIATILMSYQAKHKAAMMQFHGPENCDSNNVKAPLTLKL